MAEPIYNLDEVEKLYPDEWVAAEVVKRNEEGLPLQVRLIGHNH